MGVIFSGGETFQELWNLIPTVKDYQEYIGISNEIFDNHIHRRELTDFDAKLLHECLERYAQMKGFEPKD